MSVVRRTLPRAEWPRLVGTEAEHLWPLLPSEESGRQAEVEVVERDGRIVGCWVLFEVLHAECVWVDPNDRAGSKVKLHLLTQMRQRARAMGYRFVNTAAKTSCVRRLLGHLKATKLSGSHYVLPVADDRRELPCPSK